MSVTLTTFISEEEKRRVYAREYYHNHKEKARAHYREYYHKNIVKERKRKKKYRDNHLEEAKAYRDSRKDLCAEYHKLYRLRNWERIRKKKREYYLKNSTIINAKNAIYAKEHPEHYRAAGKRWRAKNKLKHSIQFQAEHNLKRLQLMNILGGAKCVRCGLSDIRALVFDHLKNDGNKERREQGGLATRLSYYLKNPEEAKERLQILCGSCNQIKAHGVLRAKVESRRQDLT